MIEQVESGGRTLWRLTLEGEPVRHYRTEKAAKGAATRLIKSAPVKAERAAAEAALKAQCRAVLQAAEIRDAERKAWIRQQLAAGASPADISAYLARQ